MKTQVSPRVSVCIIDYHLGNLFSVKRACELIGLRPIISSDPNVIRNSDALILPGVGAFADAMRNLKNMKIDVAIKDHINDHKPFLGICLGLQLLFSESHEFGIHQGLGVIQGKVVRFQNENRKLKVPQVGWNFIKKTGGLPDVVWGKTPLFDIDIKQRMYFVHSYYVVPEDKSVQLTETEYEGVKYCSSVFTKNIFACQFHPEKSSYEGLKIYKNWADFLEHKD